MQFVNARQKYSPVEKGSNNIPIFFFSFDKSFFSPLKKKALSLVNKLRFLVSFSLFAEFSFWNHNPDSPLFALSSLISISVCPTLSEPQGL